TFDAPHDAGAASVRDDRDVSVPTPFEDPFHIGFAVGERDDIRSTGEIAAETSDDVPVGLAQGVRGTGMVGYVGQLAELVRTEPRRRQAGGLKRDCGFGLDAAEAEVLHDAGGRLPDLVGGQGTIDIAPAPVLAHRSSLPYGRGPGSLVQTRDPACAAFTSRP